MVSIAKPPSQVIMMLATTNQEAKNPFQSFFSNLLLKFSPKKKAEKTPSDSEPSSCNSKPESEFERIFKRYDEDGDGKLSPDELRKCVGIDRLSIEDVETVFELMDSNKDGLLEYKDFMKLVEAVEKEEGKGDHLREAFEVYEMEGEDCITPKSLSRALERLGQVKSEEECEAMIERFDINGDGVISFDEFEVMMM